jgi:hypothetical protein
VDGYTIFGSCVTRDVFRVTGQNQAVELYIARMSVISAVDRPVERQLEIALESDFQRRQVHNDLYKNLVPQLGQPGITLIIDLVEERFSLAQIGSVFVTRSNETVRSGVLDRLQVARLVEHTGSESRRLFAKRAAQFRALIHPTATVILHKVRWSEEYLSDGERCPFADRITYIRRVNQHLEFCQDTLERALRPVVIAARPELCVATESHTWGLAPYHFVDGYYWDVWDKIQAATVDPG